MARASTRPTWRDRATGLLIALAAVAVAVLTVRYSDVVSLWKKRQSIAVVFDNVATLTKDSPVRYNGIEIGRVKALRPVHLDEKIIAERFRRFQHKDVDNLPITFDSRRRALKLLPDDEFDAAVKRELIGATMIELDLEVLAENDPIRYREDDEVRIVSSVFGDSAVEIISGSGPIVDSQKRQFILGTSGDFFSNLLKSTRNAKEILGGMLDLFGTEERQSFSRSQKLIKPIGDEYAHLKKVFEERIPHTSKRFDEVAKQGGETVKSARALLEGLRPAAQDASTKIQDGLKEIKTKITQAREEARVSMQEIGDDMERTRNAVMAHWQVARDGMERLQVPLMDAKDKVERAPARFDTASDTAGSMTSQSDSDLKRFAQSLPRILNNLKIVGYVAKEHKDLMLGNGDAGEYVTATVADIRKKVTVSARRMREAGADAVETAHGMEREFAAEPTIERADQTAAALAATRTSLDAFVDELDAKFLPQWHLRKRAAWRGGVVRFAE